MEGRSEKPPQEAFCINTKLTDGSEWYWKLNPVGARVPRARIRLNRRAVPAFQKQGRRLRPLSSAVNET